MSTVSEIVEVDLDLDKVAELSSLSPRGGSSGGAEAVAGNNVGGVVVGGGGGVECAPRGGAGGVECAPPPRRKSLSKLRRRLSQTFRFNLNGSLAELSAGGGLGDRSNGQYNINE